MRENLSCPADTDALHDGGGAAVAVRQAVIAHQAATIIALQHECVGLKARLLTRSQQLAAALRGRRAEAWASPHSWDQSV